MLGGKLRSSEPVPKFRKVTGLGLQSPAQLTQRQDDGPLPVSDRIPAASERCSVDSPGTLDTAPQAQQEQIDVQPGLILQGDGCRRHAWPTVNPKRKVPEGEAGKIFWSIQRNDLR